MPDPDPPPAGAIRLDLLFEIDADARAGRTPDERFVLDWARHALGAAGADGTAAPAANGHGDGPSRHELSVRLVAAETMRALNRDWRGRDAPTNVLSFPAELPPLAGDLAATADGADEADGPLSVLGDLVLCPAVIEREAAAQGKPIDAHWAHLIVHGVLHLCGHDHEDDASAALMEGLEIRLLSMRDLPDPYGDRAPRA